MKNIIRYCAIAAACALALTVVLPSFAADSSGSGIFSRWRHRDPYDRVVLITPETRSVNVVAGETVKFIERRTGQNFVWDFDAKERRSYDLGTLAPSGMLGAQRVVVHVFAANTRGSGILGRLGEPGVYNRVITITPATKWVNVAQSELVKIIDAKTGESFVWHFDGRWDWGRMDFSAVVPPGMLSREHVIAYVADQPARDDIQSR